MCGVPLEALGIAIGRTCLPLAFAMCTPPRCCLHEVAYETWLADSSHVPIAYAPSQRKAYKTFTALPEDLSTLDKNTRTFLIRSAMNQVHSQIESVALPEAQLKTASPVRYTRMHEKEVDSARFDGGVTLVKFLLFVLAARLLIALAIPLCSCMPCRTRLLIPAQQPQETLESVLATLLNQQRLLVEALDHTGEGTEDETDIHTVFQSLMQQIAIHQEHLERSRGVFCPLHRRGGGGGCMKDGF